VPRSADHEAQVQWLYEWWQRIDTWISENRPNEPEGLQTGSGSCADSPTVAPGSHG
jgi:cell wall assembly regulator SMI1